MSKEPICPIHQTTPAQGEIVLWHAVKGGGTFPAFVTGHEGAGELHLFVMTHNEAHPFQVVLACRHKDDPRHTTGVTHVDREHKRLRGCWSYRDIDLPPKPHTYLAFEQSQERQAERERLRKKTQDDFLASQAAKLEARMVSHKPEMMSVG